ncbi:MAG: hypothetical protein QOJ11_2775 [Frankiales bacterium]|jgi:pyruvate dehydrogenase E2 component (dihydrolipoamide acetyltransferase)|nr:hypothetical protein [Frankiales bacterium]
MSDFLLPDLGEGLTEAEIIAWHVKVGDPVVVDQIVVDVETAKAAVEVPVPFAGVVTALHAQAGDVVDVGKPLISVDQTVVETRPAQPVREPGVVFPTPTDDSQDAEPSGSVLIGYGTSVRQSRRPRRSRRNLSAPADPAVVRAAGPVVVVSPLVRSLARNAAVNLSSVQGTGSGGLVRRRDVEEAIRERDLAPGPAQVTDSEPGAPVEGSQRVKMTGMRKAVAEKLSRSRREIPEATVWVEVDATELLAARAVLRAREPTEPMGLMALVARFAVLGLARFPELNARIDGDEIVFSSSVHLGFAAQTERGLVVPVVRDAHRLSTRKLAGSIHTLAAAARAGVISPAQLTGGTFTVNNYGVFGVDGSAAIINHPEVAILGLGRVVERPWVVAGEIVIRSVSQLTLAFDHRVCDGATAGGFLRFVADCVESPVVALGEA